MKADVYDAEHARAMPTLVKPGKRPPQKTKAPARKVSDGWLVPAVAHIVSASTCA